MGIKKAGADTNYFAKTILMRLKKLGFGQRPSKYMQWQLQLIGFI
jgi:hypothetical protein